MMPYVALIVASTLLAACTQLGRRILLATGRAVLLPAAALVGLAAVHWFSGRPILPQQLVARRYAHRVHAAGRTAAVLLAVAAGMFGPLLILLLVLATGAGVTGAAAITRSRARIRKAAELDRSPIRVKASIGAPSGITD